MPANFFSIFCATKALGISWQHINHLNLLLRIVYRSDVYFHVRIILHHLGISLPHEAEFSKIRDFYIKSACYGICDDYGVNSNKTRVNRDLLCTTTERSLPDNLTRWMTIQSKRSTRKGTGKVRER